MYRRIAMLSWFKLVNVHTSFWTCTMIKVIEKIKQWVYSGCISNSLISYMSSPLGKSIYCAIVSLMNFWTRRNELMAHSLQFWFQTYFRKLSTICWLDTLASAMQSIKIKLLQYRSQETEFSIKKHQFQRENKCIHWISKTWSRLDSVQF